MLHVFISTMSSLYRNAKDGETIVENKHINGLKNKLECVIITFNHRVLVVNVCCGPLLILMPFATNVKHLKP